MVALTQAGVAGNNKSKVAPTYNGRQFYPDLSLAKGVVLGAAICLPFWAVVAMVVRAWT